MKNNPFIFAFILLLTFSPCLYSCVKDIYKYIKIKSILNKLREKYESEEENEYYG